MNQPRQSVAWWSFVPQHLDPATFVRTVAELGYAGIDLVPREYWPLVAQHGLRIMQIMEGDIIRTIQATADLIGHYHTAGNPGRHELDATQELHYCSHQVTN